MAAQPVRVGIVGGGRISDLHVLGYRQFAAAQLVAICDNREDVARRRAQEWGLAKMYTRIEDLLADPDIDMVEILTPHDLHASHVIAAARAGKHVSVQKPIARTLAEADQILAVIQETGVQFRVFENYIFYPPVQQAKQWLEGGEIGEPISIHLTMSAGTRGGWDVPLETWAWHLNPERAGGGLQTFDHGYHMFSLALYLMGMEIEDIFGRIDSIDGVVDAPAYFLWKYAGGCRYGVIETLIAPEMVVPSRYYPNDEWLEITGTRGIIWVNRCTTNLQERPPVVLYRDGRLTAISAMRADWADGFIDCTRHFIECLQSGRRPLWDGPTGRKVLEVSLAAQRAAQLGRTITMEEFRREQASVSVPVATGAAVRQPRGWQRLFGRERAPKAGVAVPSCAELMATLPQRLNLAAVGDWNASVQFHLAGEGGGDWVVRFADGGCTVTPGTADDVAITVWTDARVWAEILTGQRSAVTAFISGKLRAKGDMESASRLRTVFRL